MSKLVEGGDASKQSGVCRTLDFVNSVLGNAPKLRAAWLSRHTAIRRNVSRFGNLQSNRTAIVQVIC